jgi:Spy/CpxP family protein refolding chaperone
MNKLVAVAALAAAAFAAPLAVAQDAAAIAELTALQKSARADKRALVAKTLDLTPAEAKKFWPIYDDYQADLAALNRQRNTSLEILAARDRPMSDVYARNLVRDLYSIEEQELKARRKLQKGVMSAASTPVVKVWPKSVDFTTTIASGLLPFVSNRR